MWSFKRPTIDAQFIAELVLHIRYFVRLWGSQQVHLSQGLLVLLAKRLIEHLVLVRLRVALLYVIRTFMKAQILLSLVNSQFLFRQLLLRFRKLELVVHLVNNRIDVTVNVLASFDTLRMIIRPNMLLILPFVVVIVADTAIGVFRVRNWGINLPAVQLILLQTLLEILLVPLFKFLEILGVMHVMI